MNESADRWMAEIHYLDGKPQQTVAFEGLENIDQIVEVTRLEYDQRSSLR